MTSGNILVSGYLEPWSLSEIQIVLLMRLCFALLGLRTFKLAHIFYYFCMEPKVLYRIQTQALM